MKRTREPMRIPASGSLPACHQVVGVVRMQKMFRRYILETYSGAIALLPAQLLSQVNQFVFENSLQLLEPVVANNASNRDWPIAVTKTIKEKAGGDRDLVACLVIGQSETSRRATRRSHSPGQPKANPAPVQGQPAMAPEEPCVKSFKQKLHIVWMDRREVRLMDVRRAA